MLRLLTTLVSESTRSTRSHLEHHPGISESESEIGDISTPSYSLITVTDNNSDIQSENEDPEATSMDGDSKVCSATDIPETTVVCDLPHQY